MKTLLQRSDQYVCSFERHKNTSDLLFICKEGKKVHAHQYVLGRHSPYLRQFFTSMQNLEQVDLVTTQVKGLPDKLKADRSSQQVVVMLPDYSKESVEIILDILYTGQSKSTGAVDIISKQLTVIHLYKDFGIDHRNGGLPKIEDLEQIKVAQKPAAIKKIKEEFFEEETNEMETKSKMVMKKDYDKIESELRESLNKNKELEAQFSENANLIENMRKDHQETEKELENVRKSLAKNKETVTDLEQEIIKINILKNDSIKGLKAENSKLKSLLAQRREEIRLLKNRNINVLGQKKQDQTSGFVTISEINVGNQMTIPSMLNPPNNIAKQIPALLHLDPASSNNQPRVTFTRAGVSVSGLKNSVIKPSTIVSTNILPKTPASPHKSSPNLTLSVKQFAKIGESSQTKVVSLPNNLVNAPTSTITNVSQISNSSHGATNWHHQLKNYEAINIDKKTTNVNDKPRVQDLSSEENGQSKSESKAIKKPCTDNVRFDLCNVLEKRRLELSETHGLSPYMIVSDKIMEQLAKSRPTTNENLMKIKGFNIAKVKAFGEAFIATIVKFCVEESIESDIFENEDDFYVVYDKTKDTNANSTDGNLKAQSTGTSIPTVNENRNFSQDSSKRKLPECMSKSEQKNSTSNEGKRMIMKKIKSDSLLN